MQVNSAICPVWLAGRTSGSALTPPAPRVACHKEHNGHISLRLRGILRKGKASQQERGWGVHSGIQGEALKIRILGLPPPPTPGVLN